MATVRSEKMDAGKRSAVVALMSVAILITAAGIFFGVYCLLNGISYRVLNTDVPGVVFGLVAAFLGVRYCVSTYRLSGKLKSSAKSFSWSNFKIDRFKKKGWRKEK